MSDDNFYLFVGGSSDGHWLPVDSGFDVIHLPVYRYPLVREFQIECGELDMTVEVEVYRKVTLEYEDRVVSLFVHESLRGKGVQFAYLMLVERP